MPVIDEDLGNEAQTIDREPPRTRARIAVVREVVLLRSLIFGPDGWVKTRQHSARACCYRVSLVPIRRSENTGPIRRVLASRVDQAAIGQIRRFGPNARDRRPSGRQACIPIRWATSTAIRDGRFPAEQARLVCLLVERVEVSDDGIRVRLRTEGLRDVVRELQGSPALEQAA